MWLSADLQARLEHRYGAVDAAATGPVHPSAARPPVPVAPQVHGGLHWYCPGDGAPLNANLDCPQCGKHLRDLVYVLVELHPHRPVAQRDEHSWGV
jgi:hypothetical protein